ncbi:MAG: transposase, partial [Pedobacter sp.]
MSICSKSFLDAMFVLSDDSVSQIAGEHCHLGIYQYLSVMASFALPSNISREEWALLKPILTIVPMGKPGFGRPCLWSMPEIVNAVFYIVRAGCAWRMLPPHYPPWQTVYAWFRKWKRDGT